MSNGTAPLNLLLVTMLVANDMYYYPAIQLAVMESNLRVAFENEGRHLGIDVVPINRASTEEPVADSIARYYYRSVPVNTTVIIISNIWNVPIINIGGSNPALVDKSRYPTSLSMCPVENSVMVDFVMLILRQYNWTTVTLLFDDDSAHVIAFYRLSYELLRRSLRVQAISTYEIVFDSNIHDDEDLRLFLGLAQKQSRIVVVLANPIVTRQVMINAVFMNMSANDYVRTQTLPGGIQVFLFLQPIIKPPNFPPFRWALNDSFNHAARRGFESVLYITPDMSALQKVIWSEERRKILLRLRGHTNAVLDGQLRVPVDILSYYEAVNIVLKKISNPGNATTNVVSSESPANGAAFVRHFMNQTFETPSGKVYIDGKGRKVPNYVLKQFDKVSGQFQDVILYDGRSRTMTCPFGKEMSWPDGIIPANEPRCGYSGDKNECAVYGRRPLVVTGSVLTLLLIGSFVASAIWIVRHVRRLSFEWAFLSETQLDFCTTDRNHFETGSF